MNKRFVVAAALLVIEYLAISFLFDARELVPDSLRAIGDLAPMPLIVGVAFLILRASSAGTTPAPAPPPAAGTVTAAAPALLGAHVLAYGAFVATSFVVRDAGGAASLALSLGWAGLASLSLGLLVAFAFAQQGFLDMVRGASAPAALGAVVGVAAWGAGRGTGELWHPLSRLTLQPVHALLRLFSDDVVVDADRFIVGTERFFIRVDPVCSGYEGMGLVAVLLAAYVWTFRRTLRFPHALLLPVIAVIAAFFANVVRITALIYVGALGDADVAMGGFHSKAGWLLFCAVALGTTWLARRAAVFQSDTPTRPGDVDNGDNPTAAYLAPLLALVGGSLVAGLARSEDGHLDHLELIGVGAAIAGLLFARKTVRAVLVEGARTLRDGWWTGVVVGVVVFALWIGLDTRDVAADASTQAMLDALPPWRQVLWVVTRVVASVLVVPLVEELAFRGFLLRRIVAADFTAVAYRDVTALSLLVSSIAFGALHDRWLAGTLAGLAYGALVARTGRLRDAVMAHLVTNALIAALAIGMGRWAQW